MAPNGGRHCLKYGSLEEMKKAPVEELMKTARISRELAEKIREL